MQAVACNEADARIDPARHFNLTASGNTRVVKTAGGRIETAMNDLYAIDQATNIGMIVVLQHSGKETSHNASLSGLIFCVSHICFLHEH